MEHVRVQVWDGEAAPCLALLGCTHLHPGAPQGQAGQDSRLKDHQGPPKAISFLSVLLHVCHRWVEETQEIRDPGPVLGSPHVPRKARII